MFKKILIANRGEIAMRILRTCNEMGIRTVAIYSTADKDSLHVNFADEAVCVGPPASNLSYLNQAQIMAIAEITNADAIHPGYGFLSENAEFSRICAEHNIKFIGPNEHMIQSMGDKATARKLMIARNIPVVPGSDGIIEDYNEAVQVAEEIGYPVLIKATGGGGGKGMRIVTAASEFQNAWNTARKEAQASFGNSGVYLEKFIQNPRHIEIQIAGDQQGNVCHLSERDCSI